MTAAKRTYVVERLDPETKARLHGQHKRRRCARLLLDGLSDEPQDTISLMRACRAFGMRADRVDTWNALVLLESLDLAARDRGRRPVGWTRGAKLPR